MNSTRVQSKQVELIYHRESGQLNVMDIGDGDLVKNSILIRAEEIPAFIDSVTAFAQTYRQMVNSEH